MEVVRWYSCSDIYQRNVVFRGHYEILEEWLSSHEGEIYVVYDRIEGN